MSDAWTSATPLRNADFKALLTTPRPAHAQQQQQRRPGGSAFKAPRPKGGDADGEKKFKKPSAKPGKPGKPGKDADADADEAAKYRDRAKERRDGLNVDFADAEQELAARGLGPQSLQHLSIEQSKFLGGDIAHTHLVKGLDYALLQQERQKLEAAAAGGGPNSSSGGAGGAAAEAAGLAAAAAAAAAEAAAPVQFATPQGRALYAALFRPPPGSNRGLVREMFQPRRTAFVFEFDEGCSDVPTTLRRSKADCPPVQDVISAGSDAALLERISKIMSYISQTSGKGGKRSARDSQYIRSILAGVNPGAPGDAQVHGQLVMRGQAAITAAAAAAGAAAAGGGGPAGGGGGAAPGAATAAAAAPPDDDDIFGDAGTDYAPVLPAKKGAADGGRRTEGLFANRDHARDLQPHPQQHQGAADIDMDIEEGEVGGGQRRIQLPGPPPDPQQQQQQQGYPGYPGGDAYYQQQQQPYGQPSAAAEQPKWRVSTKPGAAAAAAGGGGSSLAAPSGFADEAYAECFPSMADYGVVEEDEELDPKAAKKAAAAEAAAAAGGGGKAGGKAGGKKGGQAGGGSGLDDAERKLNQKLSREVQQMQGIFKEKGWGSEAAFKREDRDRGGGGGGGGDEVAATPARKRLRI